jgi:hypothetical protein
MVLTEEYKIYCRARADGTLGKREAYLTAFPNASRDSAPVLASRLDRKPEIRAEIARLQKRTETSTVLSRQEKREFLARVVRAKIGEVDETSDLVDSKTLYYDKEGNHIRTVLKLPGKATCIEIDNKMAGHNEPEKVDVTVNGGVMFVPVASGGATLDEWEKAAATQQESLREMAKAGSGSN